MEFSWRVLQKHRPENEASNFINFHFESGRTWTQTTQTHLYLLEKEKSFPFICFSQPFFTLEKSHASQKKAFLAFFGAFHDTTKLITLSALMQRCFLWSMFYFSAVVFFIQLVSHHTQILYSRERKSVHDMKWLQFHLIATQTARNHITFICYSISKL